MENKISGVPFGKRVLVAKNVKDDSEDYENVGGLLIPKQKIEDGYIENSGVILSLGTGLDEDSREVLKEGLEITYSNGHEITFKGNTYVIVHENNIDMIITP